MMNGVLRERGAEFNASPRIKPQNSAISQNQLKSLKSSTSYRIHWWGETGVVDNLRAGARVFRELTALGFSGYLAVTYRW